MVAQVGKSAAFNYLLAWSIQNNPSELIGASPPQQVAKQVDLAKVQTEPAPDTRWAEFFTANSRRNDSE